MTVRGGALALLVACLACVHAALGQGADAVDLPVIPPNDPRRTVAPPASLPLPPPPEVILPEPEPAPPVFYGESVPLEARASIVYVLDFSQSMGQMAERVDHRTVLSRWAVAKREARRSIAGLSPAIRFGVVVFGTGLGCGVQGWRADLAEASEPNKASALAWLDGFVDAMANGGATPAGPAVVAGLGLGSGVVVLMTDGAPSACGLFGAPWESHRQLIAGHNVDHVRIDVFGVGLPDSYALYFARGVASDSGGTFVEVPTR